ncbi:MAG TPA: hypothetical protein VLG11_02275 [Candidatus Saccharimonadales bacterium]|nr:hypothetical protein [Candidatus Saccharimonadales bacterium]
MRTYDTKESAGTAFNRMLDMAKHSVFKLGVHQNYEGEDSSASWGAWRSGAHEDSIWLMYQEPRYTDWIERCIGLRNRGVKFTRAQIVDVPLSDYTQWMLSVFREYETMGAEKVVTATTEQVRGLALPPNDFVIADDALVLQWDYASGTQGEVSGARLMEPADGPQFAAYLVLRDTVLSVASPLTRQ